MKDIRHPSAWRYCERRLPNLATTGLLGIPEHVAMRVQGVVRSNHVSNNGVHVIRLLQSGSVDTSPVR